MQKRKSKSIYIADPFFDEKNFYEYKKNLKKYSLIFNKSKKTLNKNDLKKIFLKHPNIVGIIAGLEIYNFKSLYYQKNLKFISRVGVGIDSLDLDYLKKKNIKVLKLSNELTYCVAEFYLTLILVSLRKVIPNYELLKKKIWKPVMGNNLKEKKIGIIGFGKIGSKLFRHLKSFNCELFVCEKKKIKNKRINKLPLKKIFSKCDVVCICLNVNNTTKNIVNSDILNKSNKKIIIINASRGQIIDENHLFNFLKKNNKANAYLDCFVKEPYYGKLLKLKNVFPIPHIASYAHETRKDMEISASKNLIRHL